MVWRKLFGFGSSLGRHTTHSSSERFTKPIEHQCIMPVKFGLFVPVEETVKKKDIPCMYFNNGLGSCKYGNSCEYSHKIKVLNKEENKINANIYFHNLPREAIKPEDMRGYAGAYGKVCDVKFLKPKPEYPNLIAGFVIMEDYRKCILEFIAFLNGRYFESNYAQGTVCAKLQKHKEIPGTAPLPECKPCIEKPDQSKKPKRTKQETDTEGWTTITSRNESKLDEYNASDHHSVNLNQGNNHLLRHISRRKAWTLLFDD